MRLWDSRNKHTKSGILLQTDQKFGRTPALCMNSFASEKKTITSPRLHAFSIIKPYSSNHILRFGA